MIADEYADPAFGTGVVGDDMAVLAICVPSAATTADLAGPGPVATLAAG